MTDPSQSDLLERITQNISKAIAREPVRSNLTQVGTYSNDLQNSVGWLCDSLLTTITNIVLSLIHI